MATSSEFTPSRAEAGTEVNPLYSGAPVPSKSFVVGRYDEYGSKKSSGGLAEGPQEASKLSKAILQSMQTRGGQLLPGYVMTPNGPVKQASLPKLTKAQKVAKEKSSRKKVAPVEYLQTEETHDLPPPLESTYEAPEPPKPSFTVVFAIDSGTIRSTVDAILENELSIALVYEEQDKISYTPKVGSELTLVLPDKRRMLVYLAFQFQWYETEQQILVFVKHQSE